MKKVAYFDGRTRKGGLNIMVYNLNVNWPSAMKMSLFWSWVHPSTGETPLALKGQLDTWVVLSLATRCHYDQQTPSPMKK